MARIEILPQDSAGDSVAKLQLLFEYDAVGSVVAGKEIERRVLVEPNDFASDVARRVGGQKFL